MTITDAGDDGGIEPPLQTTTLSPLAPLVVVEGVPYNWEHKEYIWGPDYVDELLCQVGRYGDVAFVLTDASYNVVALLTCDGLVHSDPNVSDPNDPNSFVGTNPSIYSTAPFPAVIEQYVWTPYGRLLAKDVFDPDLSVNIANPIGHQGLPSLRLTGRNTDPPFSTTNLGLYYNRNRWYDPILGRFTSQDVNATALPILAAVGDNGEPSASVLSAIDLQMQYGDGQSLYQARRTNPIVRFDYLGLDSWDDDVDSAINDYALSLLNVAANVATAKNNIAQGAVMSAVYTAAAFLWDDLIWDLGESALIGLVTGGVGARACFTEGTSVLLPDGNSLPIEYIEVGMYVASLPAASTIALGYASFDPNTWRQLNLELHTPDRGMIFISLLRPIEWIDMTGAEIGCSVTLAIPEMNLYETATVCSIEHCAISTPRPVAGMVTGTISTERAPTVNICIESLAEPIGATAFHPLYSLDRGGWTAAGDLDPGERVQTASGYATITRVDSRLPIENVFNLEIQGTHTYFVSDAELWVHNSYIFPKGRAKFEQKGWVVQVADEMIENGQLRRVAYDYITGVLRGAKLDKKTYQELLEYTNHYINKVLDWAP